MNRFTDLRDKILPMLRPYVKRVAVFGSFARGEETPESDIDILVELKDPEKRPRLGLGWFGLEEELGRILGREVELIAEGSLSPYLRPMLKRIWFCYMKKDNSVYLRHIIDAFAQIELYMNSISHEEFLRNRLLQDGVIRQLEVMGEAARNISEDLRNEYPEIPWRQMIGLRNRMIHAFLM